MRGEGRKWKNQQGKRNVGIMRQQQTRKIHRSQIQQLNNGNQELDTTRKRGDRDDKSIIQMNQGTGNKN
jgi:hypothetical protein